MPVRIDPTLYNLFTQVPYLRDQHEEVLQALAAAATRYGMPAGHVVFLQGEPVAGLFLIETGEVKVSRVSKEGREHILRIVHAGDTFNDVAALDGGPNPATCTVRVDAVLWRIARDDLKQAALRYPALTWALIESVARRARYLVGVVEDLGMRSVRGRLANLLLLEAQTSTSDAMPRLLTQEEMASRLGTVREVVGRALRGLATDGIIAFDRHRIVILDAERLAEEAEV